MNDSSWTVLLIADNPISALWIRELLAMTGETRWRLEWADRPEIGVEYLAQRAVDAILLDLSTSDHRGLDVMRQVHTRAPAVPIVVIVTVSDETVARQAMQEGAQEYLIKREVDGNVLVRALRHAMERKQAADDLHESEARFRTIFDQAPIGIALISLDGRIIQTNPALQQMLGYRDEEFRGMPIQQLAHPDDVASGGDLFVEMVAGKRTRYQVEKRYVRKDGAIIWANATVSVIQDVRGEPPMAIGMIEDVTERKQAEEALHRRERHFRLLVESSADIVVVLDAMGTTRYVSPSVERVLGYRPDDVLGISAFAFVHPDDRENAENALSRIVHDPTRAPRLEFRCRHLDGSWKILEAIGVNLLDDPEVAGIGATLRDVTERKYLEEELRRAQKLEAIGRLAGGVAHDFGNVLTAIKGFSELLRDRLPPTDSRQKILAEITNAGILAETLTARLLAVSQQREVQPTTLDLNVVVRRVEIMLRLVIGDGVHLATDLTTDPAWITADPGQVEQVLINLASNARDAMPRGGTITIATAAVDREVSFAQRHPGTKPGPYVRLRVRDTGVGMTAEIQERIFEPFFTTKEAGEGTGLGLATVYAIVKQSGGTIDVDSVVGQGTTFTIYLPRADAPAEPIDIPDTRTGQSPEQRGGVDSPPRQNPSG